MTRRRVSVGPPETRPLPDDAEAARYGFRWGPLVVQRMFNDRRAGYMIQVRTAFEHLEVQVSPTGRRIAVGEVAPVLRKAART